VLAEMRDLGLAATELGPTGYLGLDPDSIRRHLDRYNLRLVAGFLPVLLHAEEVDLAEAASAIHNLAACGAELVLLAARSIDGSYDHRVELDGHEWRRLFANLDRLEEIARREGITPAVHPHVGTAIFDERAIFRVLEGSDAVLCIDTGHIAIAETNPLDIVHAAPERIAHVHLKDVRLPMATRVADESISYVDAVRGGLYVPLGQGDLDLLDIVRTLEQSNYAGWYVLEQDVALEAEPGLGLGPVRDVAKSISFLVTLERAIPAKASH
jgi:inosose dehydratase